MKKITFLFFIAIAATVMAQNDTTTSFESVYSACITLRDAVGRSDSADIMHAANLLRNENVCTFGALECMDDEGDLDGHLIFDEDFADSLAHGRPVMLQANSYNRELETVRGQTADGSILTKSCFAKANQSVKYRFEAKGHQELAVVAEAGGLVTLKIHVTNNRGLNVRYDDRKDVSKGRPQRKASFDMPEGRNIVELEVINTCNKDISFVVISN